MVEYKGYTLDLERSRVWTPSDTPYRLIGSEGTKPMYFAPYTGSASHLTAVYRAAMCIYWQVDCLPEGVEVHHVNHDRQNSSIANLVLLTKPDHAKAHAILRKALSAFISDPESALELRGEYFDFLETYGLEL